MNCLSVNDLVQDVLQLLNVVNPSETPVAADSQTVLNAIANLLAEWSDGGVMVPSITTEYFTTTAGSASYTVGEHGAPSLNTVRPEEVQMAWIRDGDIDYNIKIIGQRAFNEPGTSISGRPDALWVNYSAPNAVFYFSPTPDATYTIYFTSFKPFIEPSSLFETLLNTVTLPRNYYNAVKWNTAVEVAPYFEKEPSALLQGRALMTKQAIIGQNLARNMEPARIEVSDYRSGGGSILGY